VLLRGRAEARRQSRAKRASCGGAFFRERAVDLIRLQGRSSGFRIVLLAAPSRVGRRSACSAASMAVVLFAAFVPGYSGGTATDLHRFPYSFRRATSPAKHPVSMGRNLADPSALSMPSVSLFLGGAPATLRARFAAAGLRSRRGAPRTPLHAASCIRAACLLDLRPSSRQVTACACIRPKILCGLSVRLAQQFPVSKAGGADGRPASRYARDLVTLLR
jgi:hypothetical protein